MSAPLLLALLLSTQAPGEADRLIREGVELRENGDDRSALEKFAKAHSLGSLRALAQMGLVEVALRRWLDAETHLKEALARGAGDDWVAKNAHTLEDALARTKKELADLRLAIKVVGARVKIDGREVARAPLAQPLRLPAGSYQLEVSADGYKDARRTVTLAGGTVSEERIELSPKPLEGSPMAQSGPLVVPPEQQVERKQEPAKKGPGAAFWISAIGAGVSLAVGVVGLVAAVTSEDKDPGTVVAAVGGGVGVGLSVTAIVLLLAGEDAPPSSPVPLPAP